MYESVAKLPCGEVTVAKLPCGEVAGNQNPRGNTDQNNCVQHYTIILYTRYACTDIYCEIAGTSIY